MYPMLNTAIQAARQAGKLIIQYCDRIDTLTITQKGHNDFVTEVDKAAEEIIIRVLRKTYPNHQMIGEESGISKEGDNDYVWIIDPLDGTTNFIHNIPHFCISIALRYKNKLEQAVIYDPIRSEIFTASRGHGATLNERKIRISQCQKLEKALIGTGFPFRDPEYFEEYFSMFKRIFPQTAGIRRLGSAALDLAYVAAGRLDGYFEANLKPWDMAAGVLLVKEAGGLISDYEAKENYLQTGNIVAANPKIFKALLKAIHH